MLVREKIAWDAAQHDSLALSVSYYIEAEILGAMRRFHAAIATFERARSISVSLGDRQGVAFSDMRVCQSFIELNQYQQARPRCSDAAQVFTASMTTDVLKQTQEYLAEIDLHDGHVQQALGILNQVLDHSGTDMDTGASVPHTGRARRRSRRCTTTIAPIAILRSICSATARRTWRAAGGCSKP